MYRILEEHGEVRERRNQLRRPHYRKPELLAEAPNQVWSWDITKLRGPVKWTYYYLYVILDIFSRYVTGWMLAHRESAELARRLIAESCRKQDIEPGELSFCLLRPGSTLRRKKQRTRRLKQRLARGGPYLSYLCLLFIHPPRPSAQVLGSKVVPLGYPIKFSEPSRLRKPVWCK